jgi:hypothetical protein
MRKAFLVCGRLGFALLASTARKSDPELAIVQIDTDTLLCRRVSQEQRLELVDAVAPQKEQMRECNKIQVEQLKAHFNPASTTLQIAITGIAVGLSAKALKNRDFASKNPPKPAQWIQAARSRPMASASPSRVV